MRQLTVHDHMTHVIKIDIQTGHKETDSSHFDLKVIFHCIFIGKPCICLKPVQLKTVSLIYFHSFRNKYFDKISLGNMLYFQNKL